MSLIPKSIEDRGKTLTLGDVKWIESTQTDGEGNPVTRYTAAASYTGSTTSRYATGYTVSADYTGKVAKTGCDMVTYTAIFGSQETREQPVGPDGSPDADSSGTADAPEKSGDLSGLKRPLVIGGVVLALAVGGMFAFKKFKERR